MYNVLLTVGTTKFNDLIEVFDFKSALFKFTFQIADGDYLPKNGKYFRFISGIDKIFDQFDLVVCHCGAGTVYKLLENQHKCLICPNLSRFDDHQQELCNYITDNNFAKVIDYDSLALLKNRHSSTDIESICLDAMESNLAPYVKEPFFGHKLIYQRYQRN